MAKEPNLPSYLLIAGVRKGFMHFPRALVGSEMQINISWGCPRGVMVKVLDRRTVVSEFKLQLRYNIHFQDKYLWERYK